MADSEALRDRLQEAERAIARVLGKMDLADPSDALAAKEISEARDLVKNWLRALERGDWSGRSVRPYPDPEV